LSTFFLSDFEQSLGRSDDGIERPGIVVSQEHQIPVAGFEAGAVRHPEPDVADRPACIRQSNRGGAALPRTLGLVLDPDIGEGDVSLDGGAPGVVVIVLAGDGPDENEVGVLCDFLEG
jgi:hypothetical protein